MLTFLVLESGDRKQATTTTTTTTTGDTRAGGW